MEDMIGRFVVLATDGRSVLAGELVSYDSASRTARIKDARQCVYWSPDVRGFPGLLSSGPSTHCRITRAVEGESFVPCVSFIGPASADAKKAWEAEPWRN